MATSVTFCPPPVLQFFGNNGQPLVGGSVQTQVGGINAATYQDSAGATPLPNPIPLNSRGEISNASGTSCQCFLASGSAYAFIVKDAAGNAVYTAAFVTGTTASPFALAGGTAAAPTYGFSGGGGTGMYSPGANQLAWSYGGVQAMLLNGGALTINQPSSGSAITATGVALTPVAYFIGQNTSGQSQGLQIDSGTTVADYALFVRNAAGTQTLAKIKGDGSFQLGNNGSTTLLSSSGLDLVGRGVPFARYKNATTVITNNSTLASDPDLGVGLAAGTYAFRLWIPVWASAANSLKWQMAFSGTATNFFYSAEYTAGGVAQQTTVVAPSTLTFGLATSGEAGADWLIVEGTITVTVTGTLAFQEAQNTSNANSVNIGRGAWMTVTQLT